MPQAIDVFAKYQGNINWAEVKSAGVTIMFTKLTNGGSTASPAGDVYVKGAHSQKILAGGYHYALGGSAIAQADKFAAELLRLAALDIAPALDFEDLSLPANQAARRTWIVTFFTELKKKITWLSKVLIYSSGTELMAIAAGTLKNAVPGLTILVWDAEYSINDSKEHAVVHYTGTYAIHQYTSAGKVSGVTGEVDRDDVTVDVSEPHPTTPTQEDDMVPADLLNTSITYKSRVDGTTKTVKVSEALGDAASMHDQYAKGYANVGAAGPLGLEVMNTYATVSSLTAALKAVSDLLAAAHDGLTSDEVYAAVVKALQESTVQVDVSVSGQPSTSNPTPPAVVPPTA